MCRAFLVGFQHKADIMKVELVGQKPANSGSLDHMLREVLTIQKQTLEQASSTTEIDPQRTFMYEELNS